MRGFVAGILMLAASAGWAVGAMNTDNPGLPSVDQYGNSYDNNAYSSLCVACHGRDPSINQVVDNTMHGTHFVFGGPGTPTDNTSLEKLDTWAVTGGLSKYGKTGTLQSVTGEAGEIICESCHNLVKNAGRAKLLAGDNTTTDPSPLCVGCHGNTGSGHHLLTGETSSIDGQPMSNAESLFVRNTPVPGSEVTYPGPDAVNCRSCHTPHYAQTACGARILKRGYKARANAGDAVGGAGSTGMERQVDIDPSGSTRLVTDFTPLCDACHKASD